MAGRDVSDGEAGDFPPRGGGGGRRTAGTSSPTRSRSGRGRIHLLRYEIPSVADSGPPASLVDHPSGPLPAIDAQASAGEVTRTRPISKRAVAVPLLLVCADVAAFGVAAVVTRHLEPEPKMFALLGIVLLLFQVGGLYRPRLSLSVLDDAPHIVGRALAAGAAAMVLGGLDDGVAGTARLATSALFGVLSVVPRLVAYESIRAARRHGRLQQRTLLLGAGAVAGSLASNLMSHPEYGLRPVGMLDDEPLLSAKEIPVPLLGGYADISQVVLQHRVDVVIVTFGSLREHSMVPLLRTCDRLACEIYFVPRLYEVHAVTRDTEVLWGVPLLRMRRAPFRT